MTTTETTVVASPLANLAAGSSPDDVYDAVTDWVASRGIDLYPAQDEAILELLGGSHVVLATPTGSGKSLVATAAIAGALARDECAVYTAPIKALVSEKFFDLCEVFGPANVGMMTGDAAVNADAPVVVATAEVLANVALREGRQADLGLAVMDEFHFYADPDRGWAWQVPLVELPQAQLLLMSATLGDTTALQESMTRRTGRDTALVASTERPVPLVTDYVTTPVQDTVVELVSTGQAPVYIVHFTQAAAMERAQSLSSAGLATREERDRIAEEIGSFRFTSAFGKTLSRLVRMGIGVHHAGMLPRYRRLVERLAQRGLLKVVCGTDTLGVGINVPIRTVLFSGLVKYDGRRQRSLQVREFAQIAGRAGRAGFDTVGHVVVLAPEHEIENAKAVAKAGDDPKKLRKIQRKKPPEGQVSWGQSTFDKLVGGTPEALTTQLRITHAMVLEVLRRPGSDPVELLDTLVAESVADPERREALQARVREIVESLVVAGVVERLEEPDAQGRHLRLVVDLPTGFALNQPLSPFAVAAFDLLDAESPEHALDVVSVVESTLEDPRPIIAAQVNRAKGEVVAELKAEGVEYEERMEILEEVEHPKPLRELLEAAYETYAQGQPWVTDHPLRPKSVVREMAERAMTFGEYVAEYGLARSEGLVLRYLSDAYKALEHTVPQASRTEEVVDLTSWLGELVRQTDSSLLDEWESLVDPADPSTLQQAHAVADGEVPVRPVTGNERAFRVLVRNAMFRRVELAALGRWDALGELDAEAGWDSGAWADAMAAYDEEYDHLGTGPEARGPSLFDVSVPTPRTWEIRQTFDDPEGHRDWGIAATVDLDASDEAGEPVVTVTHVGPA